MPQPTSGDAWVALVRRAPEVLGTPYRALLEHYAYGSHDAFEIALNALRHTYRDETMKLDFDLAMSLKHHQILTDAIERVAERDRFR